MTEGPGPVLLVVEAIAEAEGVETHELEYALHEHVHTDSIARLTSGRTITFPGFLKAYVASIDDPARLGDTIVAHLGIKIEHKQALLETLDPAVVILAKRPGQIVVAVDQRRSLQDPVDPRHSSRVGSLRRLCRGGRQAEQGCRRDRETANHLPSHHPAALRVARRRGAGVWLLEGTVGLAWR